MKNLKESILDVDDTNLDSHIEDIEANEYARNLATISYSWLIKRNKRNAKSDIFGNDINKGDWVIVVTDDGFEGQVTHLCRVIESTPSRIKVQESYDGKRLLLSSYKPCCVLKVNIKDIKKLL